MGQRDGAPLNPATAPPPPPRISEKRLGNQLPSGDKKGSPTLQSHPSHWTGKPRGSGGETGSARSRARSSTSRRRATGRPLGIRRRRLGEASEIIGSVFPREKLSAPPFCRTFPMTLILNPLPSSRNGQSPALASTSASFSHHPAVRLQSGQHQPVTEIRARPTPSHQTPRSLRRPISAVAGARRSLIT